MDHDLHDDPNIRISYKVQHVTQQERMRQYNRLHSWCICDSWRSFLFSVIFYAVVSLFFSRTRVNYSRHAIQLDNLPTDELVTS